MIERVFNQNGWLYRFLNRLWDILVLNVLFMVTSIPLITIGTSISALFSVTLKAVKCEESYIVRSYFSAWKENLKKSTIMWFFYTAAGIILAIDIFIIGANSGTTGKIFAFFGGIVAIAWILIGVYLLPLQARFENTITNTVFNSLLVAIKFIPNTLMIIGIFAMFPLLGIVMAIFIPSAFSWYCSLLFFIGFAGSAYLSSFIYRKVFDSLLPDNEEINQSAQ